MSQIRIRREALEEVARALEQYGELLAELEQTGVLKDNTRNTYQLHAGSFVRWLKDEFDPGARNTP